MSPASRVCNIPGCPTLTTTGGRCPTHTREADQARGNATQRGYTSTGHARFRRHVLQRDPICTLCHIRPSTVADHWPLSRRQLLEQAQDPNDPHHGRGLCTTCHNQATAQHQPGGWANQGG